VEDDSTVTVTETSEEEASTDEETTEEETSSVTYPYENLCSFKQSSDLSFPVLTAVS
jgi:hypothetical protein